MNSESESDVSLGDQHLFLHSSDENEDLQKAFEKGHLKPGLNYEVPFEPKMINDVVKMKSKLEHIHLNLNWIERMDLCNAPLPSGSGEEASLDTSSTDAHNDFVRELRFYRQCQASVLDGIEKLHKLGVSTKRPDDYFAQMAKSDTHMKKVREKLISKQTAMERSQKARKLRELRKFGKKVQQDVLKKRQKDKKEMMNAVKKYRTGQQDKLDFLEDAKPKSGPKKKKENPNNPGQKRQHKNKKFGFGGQKKRSKYNTSDSTNSTTSFGKRQNSQGRQFTNKNKKNRPGKNKRKNNKKGQKE